MIEKPIKNKHNFEHTNASLLRDSELGAILHPAYETAVKYDQALKHIELVPFDDASTRIAYARPSWHPESPGHHQVFVRLDDLDGALAHAQHVLDTIPGARALFAERTMVEEDEVTPQLIHVFALLHELGHTSEYAEYEDDPNALMQRNTKEKISLPIGRATVSQLLDSASPQRAYVEQNWHDVERVLDVSSIDELIKLQHDAYRRTTSEAHADNFATDVLSNNIQLLAQLMNPDIEYYRRYRTAA